MIANLRRLVNIYSERTLSEVYDALEEINKALKETADSEFHMGWNSAVELFTRRMRKKLENINGRLEEFQEEVETGQITIDTINELDTDEMTVGDLTKIAVEELDLTDLTEGSDVERDS